MLITFPSPYSMGTGGLGPAVGAARVLAFSRFGAKRSLRFRARSICQRSCPFCLSSTFPIFLFPSFAVVSLPLSLLYARARARLSSLLGLLLFFSLFLFLNHERQVRTERERERKRGEGREGENAGTAKRGQLIGPIAIAVRGCLLALFSPVRFCARPR